MKKIAILIYMVCVCVLMTRAQVRIVNSSANTAVTNSPAFIDASSNPASNASTNVGKGLVFPRVDLSAMTAFPAVSAGVPTSFPTRFDGMIVYNTASSGAAGVGITEGTLTPGYWYYENKTTSNDGGTWKPLSSGSSVGSTLAGSTSIVVDGDSITRAGLTGDVTAAANSNTTTIADNAVTSAKIADGAIIAEDLADNAVSTAKLADAAVTAAKLNAMGATSGQVLSYNGSAWAPASLSGGVGAAGNGNYVIVTTDASGFVTPATGIIYHFITCFERPNLTASFVTMNRKYRVVDASNNPVTNTNCVFQTF